MNAHRHLFHPETQLCVTCTLPRGLVSRGRNPDAHLTGCELIAKERYRQKSAEGFSEAHDDHHKDGELVRAAIVYASGCVVKPVLSFMQWWPWFPGSYKPKGKLQDLIRAGALIAAEIDRLQRAGEEAA